MTKEKKEIPTFENFEIKVEAMVPCLFTYRIRAESPEKAIEKINSHHPIKFFSYNMRKKITKATVYNPGTINVRAIKKF